MRPDVAEAFDRMAAAARREEVGVVHAAPLSAQRRFNLPLVTSPSTLVWKMRRVPLRCKTTV